MKNIDLKKNNISIKTVALEEANIQLIKREGQKGFSFNFILDHFSSDQKSENNGEDFFITANQIELKNSRFRFKDYRSGASYYGMDFNDLDAQNINLTFSDFKNIGSNTKLRVDHLSSLEKSNFNLKNLTGIVELDSNFVLIDSMKIETPNSLIITDYFRFDFEDANDFEDNFEEKVKMTTNFRNSKVNLKDLAYFTSFFEGINRSVLLSGKFEGTVDDFQTYDLLLKLDRNTEFRGNLAMKGLPYVENTTFKTTINKLTTNEKELRRLDVPPFTSNEKLNLPPEFNGLGDIDISGTLAGRFDDFRGNLIANTSQGTIKTEARYWEENKTTFLDGTILADKVNAGHFLKDKELGTVEANMKTKLAWNSKTGINVITKGELPVLTYKGYQYKNIKLDGKFTEKSFNGNASIKDKNGEVDFAGVINFEDQTPLYNFDATIKNLNLNKLQLTHDSISHLISGNIKIDGAGSNLDNSTGSAKISNLVYIQDGEKYTNEEITISSKSKNDIKNITLNSDLADASITGNFILTEMPKIFDIIGQQVVPALYTSIDSIVIPSQDFSFDILVKDYSPINELFTPDIFLASNTKASGSFSSDKEEFSFSATSDSIIYLDNKMLQVHASLVKPSEILNLKVDIEKANVGNDFSLDNVEISSLIKEDHIMPTIKWRSEDNKSYGKIQGDGYWYTEDYFDLLVLPSYFRFKDRDWTIKEDATLIVDSTSFNFNGIEISNNLGESISAVGTISEDSSDVLKIYLDNFNIANFNPIIGNATTKYVGQIDGSACIQNVYQQIEIVSDFFIKGLKVNNETVGDVAFNTDWINEKKGMHIKGELLREQQNTFDFIGYYYPFKSKNSLDFNCILQNTDLAFLNPYVDGQGISGINGKAKGKIQVTGEPETPLLEGEISLMRTGFNVNYLNTHYDFSGLMIIDNNDIYTYNTIEIRDEENNLASFAGQIFHENFRDFDFNVYIEIPDSAFQKGSQKELLPFSGSKKINNKFIGLNTNSENGDGFYGKVYTTGEINIDGYQNEINIVVNAKTEKGTNFTLPLYGSSEVELEDYVIFIDPDSTFKDKETVSLEGINLDMNVEVTPEAKIQMIFDEVYGDIITGTGSGILSMTVDKNDEFNLAGKYTIDKGDYLFTLGLERFENLINKKFEIANGSTINWYGDPYNAEIDINAIYKLKASMYEIMPSIDDRSSNYKQRTDVECHMKLTGGLMTPDINFSIQLPRANETERAVLANLIQTQQELNKQIFSLLLLNRFSPSANSITEEGRGGTGAVSTTASEILSNQLSNWLSKLSNGVDVGLNYRPGDNITSDEIAVALSTALLNDRLVISSNFGVSQGNNVNQNQDALIGDVNVEYKLNKDGSFRVRVFTRTNEYDVTNANQAQTTSGVGVYYKKEFNNWKEFITPKRKLNKK